VAEWLGRGLQNLVQRFKSALHLQTSPKPLYQAGVFSLTEAKMSATTQLRCRHPLLNRDRVTYPVAGSNRVDKVQFQDGKVFINATQYFDGVPQSAWEFSIGGYQPAQKWLKDRKSRTLTYDVAKHYQRMIVALMETERIMGEMELV
jgi:hypothetical protein